MEDKDVQEIIERLEGVEKRQQNIIKQLDGLDLENIVDRLEAVSGLDSNGLRSLNNTVHELELIVHGDERLGVPPLRAQVKEIYTFYDRAKWALGALGVTNVGFIIAFILSLLNNGH